MQTEDLKVVYRNVSELIPYARNARTHSDEQIERIANSIKEFGWTNPILIDGENGIIAGHGRILAARKLGIEKVPTIELSGLTQAQKRAYIIADNRLALDAGWDEDILKLEFAELEKEGFELSKTGFSDEEIREMMADLDREVDGVEDVETPEPPKNPKTKRGEIWILGTHRLMCGDSTSVEDVQEVMGGESPICGSLTHRTTSHIKERQKTL